jgi:putative methyltransferase (TIGR04325 family)
MTRPSPLKRAAVAVLPPIVTHKIRSMRQPVMPPSAPAVPVPQPEPAPPVAAAPPEWEMVPDSDAVWSRGAGWSHDSIVETQSAKWPGFLRSVAGSGVLGQSHEADASAPPDYGTHNTIMTFGYVLGRAIAGTKRLSVLDWGGGLGHYFVYARAFFPEVTFDYVVKDLPALCAAGAKRLPDVTFEADEAAALARRYDLVFASSSLHYSRDPYAVLDRLSRSSNGWLMITRTPIIERHDDFVVVQRPHAYGYMTEYPGWFMNRSRLVEFMKTHGFDLERQFLVAERPFVPNAPEQAQYYGFLFKASARA